MAKEHAQFFSQAEQELLMEGYAEFQSLIKTPGTHWTFHPLSMFGMFWIDIYDSLFQFLSISSNFAQPLKRSGPTFHRPKSTT